MDVQTKTLLCVITAILVDVSGHTMIPVPRRGKNKLIFWWIIMKNRIPNSSRYWLRKSIVFIPVGSKVWVLDFNRVIRVNFYFFLNQNNIILIKKQKSTSCNRVFDRVLPGQPSHTGFSFLYFFFNLTPVSATDRPGPESTRQTELGRVSKLCIKVKIMGIRGEIFLNMIVLDYVSKFK
jgi:hypothetical protein